MKCITRFFLILLTFSAHGTALSNDSTFNVETLVRSADVSRNHYKDGSAIYLYQGNGRFGSSYNLLGLHVHPSKKETDTRFGKTEYLHLQHFGRGKFNSDYLLPLAEIYWSEPFESISDYHQHQSFYDGTLTTTFTSGKNRIMVNSWFDPEEKDLGCIVIHSSEPGLQVVMDPCKSLTLHYGQDIKQIVSINKKDFAWEITLDCLGKKSFLYVWTNAHATVHNNSLILALDEGKNEIQLSYNAPSQASVEKSLERTMKWWHEKWDTSGCIKIPDEKAQKMWVRSMAMFLSSYDDAKQGLSPPMGYTGNGWPFYFPQDVSYIHPVFLSTGNIGIAKSWIEYWAERVGGMKQYTKRLFGVDGIMCPWVFPYGSFEGYHDPAPPNEFYFEIHNSGYLARMAHETAVYVNNDEWTRKYAVPLIKETAAFYKNICTKEEDGRWHLYVAPSVGQDEKGGRNQKDYLCALYSAKYCFQKAVEYDLDPDGLCSLILNDGLAFDGLTSARGFYFSSRGRGENDFGKQKHPVQLNELAFLPVGKTPSAAAVTAYDLRYDITQDGRIPFFYGWTLGEFLLAGSRIGNAEQWATDWANVEKSDYVDSEWIQVYETSKDHDMSYYNITNGLISQSLLNNLVCDWYGMLEIAKCNPWKGKVYVKNIHSLLGVVINGSMEGKSYDITLTAWKDTEFKLDHGFIRMKKGEQLRRVKVSP